MAVKSQNLRNQSVGGWRAETAFWPMRSLVLPGFVPKVFFWGVWLLSWHLYLIWLDSLLIKAVTKLAYYHLKNIARIGCFVSSQDLDKLVHAFITSRVDYCNGLLTDLPKKTIRQLQLIQKAAASILTRTRKSEHITPGPYTGFQLHLRLILKYSYSFINHSMA